MIYDSARSLKILASNISPRGKYFLTCVRKNTSDPSFDTINMLRMIGDKELLFLQQQNVCEMEQEII